MIMFVKYVFDHNNDVCMDRCCNMQKESVDYGFCRFININIFNCIQIALNTLFFPYTSFLKRKKNCKAKEYTNFGPDPVRSGPIR